MPNSNPVTILAAVVIGIQQCLYLIVCSRVSEEISSIEWDVPYNIFVVEELFGELFHLLEFGSDWNNRPGRTSVSL